MNPHVFFRRSDSNEGLAPEQFENDNPSHFDTIVLYTALGIFETLSLVIGAAGIFSINKICGSETEPALTEDRDGFISVESEDLQTSCYTIGTLAIIVFSAVVVVCGTSGTIAGCRMIKNRRHREPVSEDSEDTP